MSLDVTCDKEFARLVSDSWTNPSQFQLMDLKLKLEQWNSNETHNIQLQQFNLFQLASD